MYSSQKTALDEDSIAIGGYLDVWKPATFWGGIDMQGTVISNLKPGVKDGDAATVGQVNKVAGDLANITGGGGIKYFRANSSQPDAVAKGANTVAIGPNAVAEGGYSQAMGGNANSAGSTSVAIGDRANTAAAAARSVALGASASAKAESSVALGDGAVADRANTVSVGSAAKQRQIVNLSKGVADTDAVNVSQLKGVTSSLGGGAGVGGDGSVLPPSYSVGGKTVNNVGDALTEVDGRVTNLGDTVNNINNGAGIKYFRASSTDTDAKAQGTNSVAVGPAAEATAQYSTAIGSSAKATGDTALAVGEKAEASAYRSAAFGRLARASGDRSLALGLGTTATAADSTALGNYSVADRDDTISVGSATKQRQIVNVAKGTQDTDAVNLSQLKPFADSLGGGAKVNPDGSVTGPTYNVGGKTVNNVGDALTDVDGRVTNLGDTVNNITNGGGIKYFRAKSGAADASATGAESVAIGPNALAEGGYSMAMGGNAISSGDTSLAVGDRAAASGVRTIALGASAAAAGDYGVAIGEGAKAQNAQSVALGAGSVTAAAVPTGSGYAADTLYSFAGGSPKGTVSVGNVGSERTVTNVAAGRVSASSTDAVNGSQLFATNQELGALDDRADAMGDSVAANLGGGAKYDPESGKVLPPSYSVGGKTVNNVGDALTAVDGRVTNLGDTVNNINNGAGIKYFRASSTDTDAKAQGTNSVAVGPAAEATAQYSTAIGSSAKATGDTALAVGEKAEASAYRSAAFGRLARASGDRSLALGLGTTATAADSTALGNYSVADRDDTISVGSATKQRQIVNVAKGTQDTDAVNLSQLKPFADSLGGGAKVNPDGSVTGPTYTVGDKPVTNVGDAITNLGDLINNVSADGIVKQDLTSREITVGKATDGKKINLKGTAGDRVVTGVADGAVVKDSKDAVNGGQLFAAEKASADALGGGAKVNPDGSVTGPTYNVGGKTVNTVNNITNGAGIKYFRANSSLADAVASGMDSVAIGPMAMAQAANAVALGKGALADRANTVSVGAAGNERQVVNVAKGTQDTDAVNLSQLKPFADSLGGGSKVNPDGSVNGRYVYKAQLSGNTQGDVGFSVGAGIQW